VDLAILEAQFPGVREEAQKQRERQARGREMQRDLLHPQPHTLPQEVAQVTAHSNEEALAQLSAGTYANPTPGGPAAEYDPMDPALNFWMME
jgi:hypothetical protein